MPTLQRKAGKILGCRPNEDGAKEDPVGRLRAIDLDARVKCLAAALDLLDGRRHTAAFRAYQRRFGMAEQLPNGRFGNRFNGRSFSSEGDAVDAEMEALSDRLGHLAAAFGRGIHYRCVGFRPFVVGNCISAVCGPLDFAQTCSGHGVIAICPHFWGLSSDEQRAFGLIHEVAHVIFGFGDPPGSSMTTKKRGVNPVCYSGLVAEMNGSGPPDPDCPPV